jgi:pimeloyl-ACP methyl ester carboxylesterase
MWHLVAGSLVLGLSHAMLNPPPLTQETVQHLEAPTLLVWGDRDQFLPVEEAVTLYRWLPNAQLAIIPNADHFVTRTHQGEFGRIVTNFLETVSQRASTGDS